MPAPVIDFHIHPVYYEQYCDAAVAFIQSQHPGADWSAMMAEYADPARFARYLAAEGIDYGVVLAELSPATTGTCPNAYVAGFCRGLDRLIPFANVNPALMTRPARELERLVKEDGFKGLKLYPTYQYFYPNDPQLYPVYAKAEELGIPVMIHTGSSVFAGARLKYGQPLFLDDVAVDFPALTLVMVHSGRGVWYEQAFFLARLHPNLYMEVAGLPPQKLLDYFPELERNADKVIFGSDWPGLASIRANIETIQNLPLSPAAKEKILGGNAARILGLEK